VIITVFIFSVFLFGVDWLLGHGVTWLFGYFR
jgi:preprotein translocase SecE subunit